MKDERFFDCAQVLILPDTADAEKAVQLIRSKQFWHVAVSGTRAYALSRTLREHPGMPNFLIEEEGDALHVKSLLALRNVHPLTLAVTQAQCAEYASVFPQAKIFIISV